MKCRLLPLFALFFLLGNAANAQYDGAPNGFAFRWTTSNFQYPITKKFDRFDYTSGVEFKYIRHLGKFINIAAPLKLSKSFLPLDDQGNVRDAELFGSLDLVLHLKLANPAWRLNPYLLGGAGLMAEVDNDWAMNTEFPVGLGLNVKVAPNLYISGETQYRLDLTENRDQLQHALGIWIVLNGKDEEEKISDKDKDGIPDSEDQCPDQPGTAALLGCPDSDNDGVANKFDDCPDQPGKPTLAGCPDRDNDGVADQQDRCPDEAGKVELAGCPDNDQDGDGVADDKDQCPDAPGSPQTNGCPDLDSDGIADADDKCPTVAGLPKLNGCPDSDNDGVADPEDRCPTTAGPASNKGCPELKPEEKEVLEFAMKAVQFETGSARLLSASNKVLDEIAGILKNYPEQKLRIGGHTDSIGEAPENQKLSEKRAKACHDYLAAKGISTSRMSYTGFGESKPIGDNRFAPGREKNRRVEFEIYVD